MGRLLDQVVSPENLNRAWRRLRKDQSRWDVHTSRIELEQNFVAHIGKLTDDLRQGVYRPGNLRQFNIAKVDGSQRTLSALYLRDKLAQRAVLQVVEPIGEALFDDDSYGYRPGRGVELALRRARERINCGMSWLLDADLRKFFDEIPHKLLLRRIKQIIEDRQILSLMDGWLKQGTMKRGWMDGRRGIAQGAVLSPFQCNLYLHDLDSFWRKRGIAFVRYADDFLLFSETRRDIEAANKITDEQLTRMDIAFNLKKTRIVQASMGVSFLGEVLCHKETKSKKRHRLQKYRSNRRNRRG